jgi:hypothetical protein
MTLLGNYDELSWIDQLETSNQQPRIVHELTPNARKESQTLFLYQELHACHANPKHTKTVLHIK